MNAATDELAALASINLAFAQAKIAMAGDRESILRALDHIRQAKACLKISLTELDIPPDEAEEAA
jgi:hypothetical protein